ncbi:hypothetical protein [Pseudomonas sp. SDI]|uniref:hypothetical protein n=1 Tax=Pseudomonas sp. SDI TaxID=2170734 RepID=UPI003531C1CA
MAGVWLAGAGSAQGAPIPTRIADRLRGREFSSFDAFRKAFWIEVSNDPTLSSHFGSTGVLDLQRGYAPAAPKSGYVGKRKALELHHVARIVDGGAVYDVDNIRVNTPRNHIDIHREGR